MVLLFHLFVLKKMFRIWIHWDLKYYGVKNVKLMNGGRKKWLLEDRPVTRDLPTYKRVTFRASGPDESIRVYKDYVRQAVASGDRVLVDVRGPKEFTGEVLAPPEYPTEHAQRGGRIPGAKNIPWGLAVNDADGTFKSRDQLEELYRSKGVTPDREVLTYCRIGERSSFSLVRAEIPARLPGRQELRRLLDRVGEFNKVPHREVDLLLLHDEVEDATVPPGFQEEVPCLVPPSFYLDVAGRVVGHHVHRRAAL